MTKENEKPKGAKRNQNKKPKGAKRKANDSSSCDEWPLWRMWEPFDGLMDAADRK